jgi:hypothetical protein
MASVFGRMTESVLSLLGEDALLRGATPCKVNIEHDVQLTGMDGERASHRGDLYVNSDVITLAKRHNPKGGDSLKFMGTGPHAGRSFRLETMIEDNGYSRRYIVIETTVP